MIDFEKSWNHSFSVTGHWWLPENAEIKIPGTLNYENGQIRVELLGSFDPNTFLRAMESANLSIINGRAQGRLLTLLDCRTVSKHTHSESADTSTLDARIAFDGVIFTNTDSMQFTEATIRLHHLEAWVQDDPVIRNTPSDTDRSFSRTYTLPDDRLVPSQIDDSYLTISSQYQSLRSGREDFFNYQNVLFLRTAAPRDLQWFLDKANSLSSLLSFLIGQQTGISHLNLEVPIEPLDAHSYPRYCRVYVRHWPFEPKKELGVFGMRYCYPMITERFPNVVDKWFSRSDQLRTAFELVAGAQLDKDIPVRFQFLNLIHALECLDRANGNRFYISEDAYQPFRRVMSNAIPSDLDDGHKESLKTKLKYGYEVSLRNRLSKMLSELPVELLPLVCLDPKQFANLIADTRNYFSHYTAELKAKAVTDTQKLYWLAQRLSIWCTCLLLREMSFSPAEIAAGMERCRQLHWTLQKPPEC